VPPYCSATFPATYSPLLHRIGAAGCCSDVIAADKQASEKPTQNAIRNHVVHLNCPSVRTVGWMVGAGSFVDVVSMPCHRPTTPWT
jgi:hypothetical protein